MMIIHIHSDNIDIQRKDTFTHFMASFSLYLPIFLPFSVPIGSRFETPTKTLVKEENKIK